MAGEVPAYGWEEKVGFAFEDPTDTYGTKQTPLWWLRPISFNVSKDQTPVALPGAVGVPVEIDRLGALDIPRTTLNAAKISGASQFELEYETIVPLMIHLLCSHNHAVAPGAFVGYTFTENTGPNGAEDDLGRHVLKLQTDAAKMPPPMTMVRYTGQEDKTFTGSFIRSAEIKVGPDGSATLTLDWMGHDAEAGSGAGTPAFVYSETIRLQNMTFKWHSTVGHASPATVDNIHELTLRIERPLREIESSGTADGGIRYPVLEDFWAITVDIVTDWDSDDWADVRNATTMGGRFGCLEIMFESDDNSPSTSDNYGMEWRFPSCMCTTPSDPEYGGGAGPLTETVSFKVANFSNSGTDEIAELTVWNERNTAVAPSA